LPKSSPRIVVDTSALISLAHGSVLDLALEEFHFIVSDIVIKELEETSQYSDPDGKAAQEVLKRRSKLEIREVKPERFRSFLSGRVDPGEASCLVLAQIEEVKAFISDDFHAMHKLEYYSKKYSIKLGLCATLIKALTLKGRLSREEAIKIFDKIAQRRGWLGKAIYEYGKRLL